MRTLYVVIAALLPAAALAQSATVVGEVVSRATGLPVAGARVNEAITGTTGHFEIPMGSSPAGLMLTAYGPGYLASRFNISRKPGEPLVHVTVKLTPQSVITGKLTDENGWPIDRANVELFSYVLVNGVRELRQLSGAMADDRGEYRIARLRAGKYYIRVIPSPELQDWDGRYAPVYFPAAESLADARPIELGTGSQERTDIRVTPRQGFAVRGRVVWPDNDQPYRSTPLITLEQGAELNHATRPYPVAPDGTFTIRHLPPGSYSLSLNLGRGINDMHPPKYSARVPIEITNSNLDGIVLNLAPVKTAAWKGSVEVSGGIRPETIRIRLQRFWSNLILTADVNPDGTFTIPGMWAGRYRASIAAPGAPVSINSARFGTTDVTNGEFEWEPSAEPLRIVVSNPRANLVHLTGSVTNAAGQPVPGASVLLLPAGRGRTVTLVADQDGALSLRTVLRPGTYRVYASEDGLVLDQFDAAYAQAHENDYPPVTLAAGENPPLALVLH